MPSCTKRPMRCLSILNTWVRLITPCSGKLSSAHRQTYNTDHGLTDLHAASAKGWDCRLGTSHASGRRSGLRKAEFCTDTHERCLCTQKAACMELAASRTLFTVLRRQTVSATCSNKAVARATCASTVVVDGTHLCARCSKTIAAKIHYIP